MFASDLYVIYNGSPCKSHTDRPLMHIVSITYRETRLTERQYRYTIKQKSTRIFLFRWRTTQAEIGFLFSLTFALTVSSVSQSLIFIKNFVDNGHDGKYRTLNSKSKKCTMLFPVKVTNTAVKEQHDMSYGKSYNPNGIVKTL